MLASNPFPRSEARSHVAAIRWTTRVIPLLILGVIGFACWALTKPICIDFFILRKEYGSAIVFLVLHYTFLVLMLVCYGRTVHTVIFNPGLVPLEPKLGLDSFYTRDSYLCRSDGLPIWCSDCQNWKPDRAHHSRDIQRCVKKMDHYCPWAGGMIGETSFKFFAQFVTYTALYCAICLSAGAYVTSRLARQGTHVSIPAIVLIAVAAFFGLFSFVMAGLSHCFALLNITNVENLSRSSKVYQFAIRIPIDQAPGSEHPSVSPDYETITFPLANPAFNGNQFIYENHGGDGTSDADRPPVEHRFAIVKTEMGDNPWHSGSYYKNWTSVMGERGLADWLLPLRLSPCCNYNCEYPVGPAIDKLSKSLKK